MGLLQAAVVVGVIGLLVFFILACVFIMAYKFIQIRRAQGQTHRFLLHHGRPQDGLLGLFKSEDVGRNVKLQPATLEDMFLERGAAS